MTFKPIHLQLELFHFLSSTVGLSCSLPATAAIKGIKKMPWRIVDSSSSSSDGESDSDDSEPVEDRDFHFEIFS